MATEILGLLGSIAADGTLIPLELATIYVSPSQATQLRIQYGGAGPFNLVTANTALPVPYQYGFSTATDGVGQYDFYLPEVTEIHTPDPAFKWNITLPDGSVYSGPALAGAGPYTLDDLIETQGWELASSLVVQATVLGQVAQASVTVTAQQTVEVEFVGPPMADEFYQVFINPGKDDATEQIPAYDVINKTANGFTVELSFELTGKMDYLAWHP